jgi:muconolactone delta-isomerase
MKLYEEVLYFIAGHRRGWAFSSSDLMKKFTRQEADSTLSDLAEKGKIRRVYRGIYDYPKYSDFLQQELSPDIDQVARAIARKFNWRIEISGDSALNMLGLSTQIEGKHVYLSDGPKRSYDILGTTLQFKRSILKNIGFKHKESSLIVQALKALGKERITTDVISKIRKHINPGMYNKIMKDTQSSTVWIYETIKQICREN